MTGPSETSGAPDPRLRELIAVREIVHAFLTADRPEDVFQFALERVSPLVGATFASVYVIDGESDTMRLAAAYNWPERYQRYLGHMRVKVGLGPSGEAVSDRRSVHVPDIQADESLAEWRESFTELGVRALVALPLQTRGKVLGAVTFYYADPVKVNAEEHGLLRIVADQMAATAEKASMIDQLRRTNAALVESNAELEKLYLESLEARRVKDEFLANMSHELRTPLTAVLGYTYLLQEGLSGPVTEEQRVTLTQVSAAGERLLLLIEDLLHLTTLRRGELKVELDRFDPRDALHEAVFDTVGLPKGVTLRVAEPEDVLPTMLSDRKRVVKVLASLLSNAYKFTEKGEITASVEVRGDMVYFAVRDTGIGISAELQGAMFEEFRQGDSSTTRRFGGSGLGLSLARQLARSLGGDISVQSAPREGSTFTVELPLEYAPDLADEAAARR
ncbi:MAG: GAF domain-containing sensor histidine kinase [Gemmatimonadota bacterium]|nr:GAF domain-containing sensor histidine kinase [Gemmatimonadota bacterium]